MPEYTVFDKDTIKSEIVPCLSIAKRGFTSKFNLVEIVNAILYKLRSGCQWRLLPIGHLFSSKGPSWNTVFHHYRKWSVREEWQKIYSIILNTDKSRLDLSLSHIDGSHTPAYRGGEKVEYQGRKKCRTTNALFLSDNQGIPLTMSEPQAGNHADLYEIGDRVDEPVGQLTKADIAVDGLFCNLDAGFDGKQLRSALTSYGMIPNVCPNPRNGGENTEEWLYDEEMYKHRWKMNAQMLGWMGSKPFSHGSTPQYPVGKDGTFSHLSLFPLKFFTIQISLNNFYKLKFIYVVDSKILFNFVSG